MDFPPSPEDIVLKGLSFAGLVFNWVVPERFRKQAVERLSDFNPFKVINGNHDLIRAVRLAWIAAALEIFKAALERARPGNPDAEQIEKFVAEGRKILREIRAAALDRRTVPEAAAIDAHVQTVINGTPEFIAPHLALPLVATLTGSFVTTLGQVTGWNVITIPSVFGNLAASGLPVVGGGAQRRFGELVFAAFAELLKDPKKYPQANVAFQIGLADGTRQLVQSVFNTLKDQDEKLDAFIATADTLATIRAGIAAWQSGLPKLLEGQQRIEALAIGIDSKVDAVHGKLDLMLQHIQDTARSRVDAPEAETITECQTLVSHLNRGEFEQVLNASKPRSVEAYHARCIARWSQRRHAIDKNFTPLTLLLDRGEEAKERYEKVQQEFTDLRDVLKTVNPAQEPVLVVTGAPGSGKSTLLRRLQLDFAMNALRSGAADASLTILLPLNAFGQRDGAIPEPASWIAQQWHDMAPALPAFDALLGRPLLLLLDGLNEMPHTSSGDYNNRLSKWKLFLDTLAREHPKVRAVFTCRTLDYGEKLTTRDLPRVPQVQVTPLSPKQVLEFLKIYSPEHGLTLWSQLENTPQLALYSSPFYLDLLIKQTGADGKIPQGRAALFTGYVRAMLKREIDEGHARFLPGPLLASRDREKFHERHGAYDLPARGLLFNALADFAFGLQTRRGPQDKAQVRIDYDDALKELSNVPEEQKELILKAAADLQIIEQQGDDVLFVHQLLQEYFAARHLAGRVTASAQELAPLAGLAQVKWREADIAASDRVAALLQTLPLSATLPDLPTTGWEETFSLAAAMLPAPHAFLRALAEANLPLAGRCAAQPDVRIGDSLRDELRHQLVERSRDLNADLRARITAGLALGELGDPRLTPGPLPENGNEDARALFPRCITIAAGDYSLGTAIEKMPEADRQYFEDAKVTRVTIASPFDLAQFPVTNAEWRRFMAADGYNDLRWWQSDGAKEWQAGKATGDAKRRNWRYFRNLARDKPDEFAAKRARSGDPDSYKKVDVWAAMDEATFEQMLLDEVKDLPFKEPAFWRNPVFNAPAQPVVGVCWFEVSAYCAWLSAEAVRGGSNNRYRLPTEVEREAATGGLGAKGRTYAWSNVWDATHCNTPDTRIKKTTPVGVFPHGDTPEGVSDLAGNVTDWTSTLYRPTIDELNDGREDPNPVRDDAGEPLPRVVRGGSWSDGAVYARAAYRLNDVPGDRYDVIGFRVVRVSHP